MEFTRHTPETAPEAGRPLLQASQDRYKFVPNLHAVMAEAPPLLEAYQALGDLYSKTSMSVLERQIVLMSINYDNNCHYCMAAHSAIATMEKMPEDILTALREGKPLADIKLEALRAFAAKLSAQRGWVDDADVQIFLDAGYTKQTVLEIVLAVGYKVLSNYTNHLAQTPVDPAFKDFTWSKPAATAAE